MSSTLPAKSQMQQALSAFEEDLRTLRPGRASADLVASLPIASYGSTLPLQQVAAISSNDQGNLIVQVWDKRLLGAVEAAIRDSQLGFSVVNDGAGLRLMMPPLSRERRQELVKVAHQKGEATRIRLRQIRTDAIQHATKGKADGSVREDELNRLTKELNQVIEECNQSVKKIVEAKEKELLTV